MASPSRSESNPEESKSQPSPPSSTPAMSSEGSDTVLLNRPDDQSEASAAPAPRPGVLKRQSTLRKCWICLNDASEDDMNNPPTWRSPCACNLTAHEDCLLDWVADLESPKNKRKPSGQVLCPQCKTEIKVSRPRSYVLDATRLVDREIGRLILPGLALSLSTTLFAGAWVHGFQSVYLVFGRREAARMFGSALSRRGWAATYALIPLNLIFARTRYADFILPSGTLFLLSTQLTDSFQIDWTIYPPLPSTVFACLPAIQKFYNWSYNQAFGEMNKKWLEEIQPRQNERTEDLEMNAADIANQQEEQAAEEGGIVVELEVNIGQEEDGDAGDQRDQQNEGDNAGQDNQNGHVHQILGERGEEIVETSSGLGSTMLGALAFPAVAAGMGELLSHVIPRAWMTDANWVNGRPGLLRNKWGRSVVGGCLFVVLKDALLLYCRWRMAQSHRQRRIMDYDKAKKQYVI